MRFAEKEFSDVKEAAAALADLFIQGQAARKQADLQSMLASVRDYAGQNPALTSTLGGAAAGGAIGGLSSLAKPKEERNVGRSALTGALSGAALGGGGYLVGQHLPGLLKKLPHGQSGGPSLKPSAGKPELLAEVEKLRSRSPVTQAIGATWDQGKNYARNHPILASMLGLDVLSHGVGTAADVANPHPSLDPAHLTAGITKALGEKGEGKALEPAYKSVLQRLKNLPHDVQSKFLAEARQLTGGPKHLNVGGGSILPSQVQKLTNEGLGGVRRGGFRSLLDLGERLPGQLGQKIRDLGPLYGTGYAKSRMGIKPVPGVMGAANRFFESGAGPRGLPKFPGAGIAARLALYGGIPAYQAYRGIAGQESANQKRLQELMQQLQGAS